MVSLVQQQNRPLRATTPLGGDVLVPVSLHGDEFVSRTFSFMIEFISVDAGIQPSAILGKPLTVHLRLSSGERHINGIVKSFTALGREREYSRYRAELVPSMWLLTLSSATRTFEDMTVLDIVEKVCKQEGVTSLKRRVSIPPKPLPYVVQYGETNFQFVSRLLEEAGLYYSFDHTKDSHSLVFSDAMGATIPAGPIPSVKVVAAYTSGEPEADAVTRLEREHTMHSASFSLKDHALLRADSSGSADTTKVAAKGVRAAFLGDLGPNDSAGEAKRLIELEESLHDVLRGESRCEGIQAGTRVKVTGGATGTAGAELLVLHVVHRAQIGDVLSNSSFTSEYSNHFAAIPISTRYRPPRATPRPSVRGTQTAIIVGTGGQGAIDVDADGRVILQFPWDTGVGKGGGSKHRVHLASLWAGAGWGFVQLPRIGQEVLVEFLEGDVSRPLVTGRIYNAMNKAPYALPAHKTQSGWKSRTLGGSAENFNEIRFEDEKGEEHIFMQAEKDLETKVKHDERRHVLHDRITMIDHSDTRTVKTGDDTHTVKTGKQTTVVHSDCSTTVEQGNRSVQVDVGHNTLKVKTGNHDVAVETGNISVTAKLGKITIEAMQSIELKVGGSIIKMDPTGITIHSTTVKIEGQAQAQLKGAMVQVEGQAMTQIKAPMTQVTGTGMLIVKGGVTMIN